MSEEIDLGALESLWWAARDQDGPVIVGKFFSAAHNALPLLIQRLRAAEARETPLRRLAAWARQRPCYRTYKVSPGFVELYDAEGEEYGRRLLALSREDPFPGNYWMPTEVVVVGTVEEPAPIEDCVEAALGRWHEKYGDQE